MTVDHPPKLLVEVAWDTDPLTRPADADFTDLADEEVAAFTLKTKRGARLMTGESEPCTAQCTVSNPGRVLEPGNPASPWAPNVDLRRRIRWSIQPPGESARRVLTGFISRLPNGWQKKDARVQLEAIGLLQLIDEPLPPSVLHAYIVGDGPTNYWPLGESGGTRADDVVGLADGEWNYPVGGGADGVPWDPRKAQKLSYGTTDGRLAGQRMQTGTVQFAQSFSLEFWFRSVSTGVGNVYDLPIVLAYDASNVAQFKAYVAAVDRVLYFEVGSQVYKQLTFERGLFDGRIHHVLFQYDDSFPAAFCHIDGVQKDFGGVGGGSFGGAFAASRVVVGADYQVAEVDDWKPEEYAVAHVALYDRTVGAQVAVDHTDAGLNAWENDLDGERLDRILDLAGVDPGDRDITAGTVRCGPTMLDSQGTLDYVRKIAATRGAPIFESADGKITFPAAPSNALTATAVFSDDPATDGGVPYEGVPVDWSADRLVTVAEVSREAGDVQRAESATKGRYGGSNPVRLDTLHASPSAARAQASELVTRYGTPRRVIDQVTVSSRHYDEVPFSMSLDGDPDVGTAAQLLARPDDGAGGDPIDQTVLVGSVAHDLGSDGSWKTTFGVVEHVTLPDFAWDTPGQGWDESEWS